VQKVKATEVSPKWVQLCVKRIPERREEIDSRFRTYRTEAPVYFIGSMPVVVDYSATIGWVEHSGNGEDSVFSTDLRHKAGEKMFLLPEEVRLNAFTIREKFFKVRNPEEAAGFLQKTGFFSPLSDTITWREFKKWQQFARLVQEYEDLATAMRNSEQSGDCAEVWKALTGIYPSSFFDGCQVTQSPGIDESWAERLRKDPEVEQKKKRRRAERFHELCRWFIHPPVSIEWIPKSQTAARKVLQMHVDSATGVALPAPEESPILRGGAMIELLLRPDELKPVLLIRPRATLQAIAAAIYAERLRGVTFRKCAECKLYFRIGNHPDHRWCSKRCRTRGRKREWRSKKNRTAGKLAASKTLKGRTKQTERT